MFLGNLLFWIADSVELVAMNLCGAPKTSLAGLDRVLVEINSDSFRYLCDLFIARLIFRFLA